MKNTSKIILSALSITLVVGSFLFVSSCESKKTDTVADDSAVVDTTDVAKSDTAQTSSDTSVSK